ncbi:hypothetical protein DYP60_10250 [Sphaerochaeta halotolerans]|uniref:Uncharacterized protein n=1 Tax=Sphaerochaeta halotolerans TaxID=2293840 RepID=A0A372MF32_9SPIR|nr:hypothetical protein DYP60_10250 [Sphaerochaeta halotolerans]
MRNNKPPAIRKPLWPTRSINIVLTPKYVRKAIYNQYRLSLGQILRSLCGCEGLYRVLWGTL